MLRYKEKDVISNEKFNKRKWINENLSELNAIFLTNNPYATAYHHGFNIKNSNVCIVKISENVIKKSNGLHRFDNASEVIISKEIWEMYLNKEIFIIGKMSESKIKDGIENYIKTMNHNFYKIELPSNFRNQFSKNELDD